MGVVGDQDQIWQPTRCFKALLSSFDDWNVSKATNWWLLSIHERRIGAGGELWESWLGFEAGFVYKILTWYLILWKNISTKVDSYRVFARRVNTFVTSFFPFFYNINIAINDFTYSKFCEDSEYVHFKRDKWSQKASKQSNQDLANFALAHSKFNHNWVYVNLRS